MASGSFAMSFSSGSSYLRGRVDWSSVAGSAQTNSSTVTTSMYLWKDPATTSDTWGTGNFYLTVDGNYSQMTSERYDIPANGSTVQVITSTYTIPHNPDGSKSIIISWSGNGDSPFTIVQANGGANLDKINRYSTIGSAVNWTAGIDTGLAVSLTTYDATFTNHFALQVQNPNGTWTTVADRPSPAKSPITFSVAENTSTYQQIGGWENRPARLYVDTYDSSGNFIGEDSKDGTVYGYTPGTVTFADFNIGNSVAATIDSSYNTKFTYDLKMTFGSFTKTWSSVTQNYTMTFTSTDIQNMYSQIPNANAGAGSVYCDTKYNGVSINDGLPVSLGMTHNFTAYVTNSNPIFPVSSISYRDNNSTTATLTGNNQYILKNKSTLMANIGTAATPQNAATMSSYTVALIEPTTSTTISTQSVAASAIGDVSIGSVTTTGNKQLKITAVDSRGNTTSQTLTVNVVDYNNPVITLNIKRVGYQNRLTLDMSTKISLVTISGVNRNGPATTSPFQYRYKKDTDATWGAWNPFAYTTSSDTSTMSTVTLELDSSINWNFDITATDKLPTTSESLFNVAGGGIVNYSQPSSTASNIVFNPPTNGSGSVKIYSKIYVPIAIQTSSLSAYFSLSTPATVTFGIWDLSGNLITSGTATPTSSKSWVTATLSPAKYLEIGTYYVGIWVNAPSPAATVSVTTEQWYGYNGVSPVIYHETSTNSTTNGTTNDAFHVHLSSATLDTSSYVFPFKINYVPAGIMWQNVGGTWKLGRAKVNVSGTWNPAKAVWKNVNGTWQANNITDSTPVK